MPIGPVEFLVVGFPENRFTGEIAPALRDLVESKTIRIIDLAFVSKDPNGDVLALEVDDLESEVGKAFAALSAGNGGILNEANIREVGDDLEPNSSAAVLVWEDLWATRFAEALRGAGGVLIARELIPHEAVQIAVEWAAAQKAEVTA